jgi:hypothetical protein
LQKGAKGTEWGERFALVLEAFLRGCGSVFRADFFGQYDVYLNIKVCFILNTQKTKKEKERRNRMGREFALAGLWAPFFALILVNTVFI